MLGYSSVSGVQSHSPYGCRSPSSDHTASPVDQALADVGNVGILHHASPLDFPGLPHARSHQCISGRMISCRNGLPQFPPLPGTHWVLIFHSYTLLSLPNILLVHPKSAIGKFTKLKLKKVPSSAGCWLLLIPLNAARNGCELGWQCSIFERSIASGPCVSD